MKKSDLELADQLEIEDITDIEIAVDLLTQIARSPQMRIYEELSRKLLTAYAKLGCKKVAKITPEIMTPDCLVVNWAAVASKCSVALNDTGQLPVIPGICFED